MANTTTANLVFQMAIHLMDEQNETNGEVHTQDTEEYEFRTLDILNTLRHELFPYSDTYEVLEQGGYRPICPKILTMDQVIYLDDAIAQGVMPYGLAAHLLLGENDSMASYFQQRYDELKYALGNKRPGQWETIRGPFD